MAFMIWMCISVLFFIFGIRTWKAEKPVTFFTFQDPVKVREIKKYNHAVAKLWFTLAVLFGMVGVPFLFLKQNSPYFFFISLIVPIISIGIMIAYSFIQSKYSK